MPKQIQRPDLASAVAQISNHGVLLVFPLQNRELPRSLWSEFFPNRPMLWSWNEDSDHRVSDMWSLMKRLSDCRQVVYSKWFQGRATFFSVELFTALVSLRSVHANPLTGLDATARLLLDVLQNNSPLSTKDLKRETDLQGRLNEGVYSRAMKALFSRFLIVGYGEVEDGAFPSLAVGATELLYEDVWRDAAELRWDVALASVDLWMPAGTPFRRFLDKS